MRTGQSMDYGQMGGRQVTSFAHRDRSRRYEAGYREAQLGGRQAVHANAKEAARRAGAATLPPSNSISRKL